MDLDPGLNMLDLLGVVVAVDVAGAVVELLAFRPHGDFGDFRQVLFSKCSGFQFVVFSGEDR